MKIIKKIVPNWLKYTLKVLPSYWYDFTRFYKFSGFTSLKNENQLRAMIIHDYHVIEKGLTMPETRFGFGVPKLLTLISLCERYINKYGYSNMQIKHAVQVINEYVDFHRKANFSLGKDVEEAINRIGALSNDNSKTTQRTISSKDYFANIESGFSSFSASRSSVRNYADKEIDLNDIIDAVSLARNTPSACNRQTAKAYVFTKKEDIDAILNLQGGNRGFGHLANKLIVVTADLSVFFGANERYQTYVDGGMFAMNLLYALHEKEILACILNCSHNAKKDKAMRRVCPINENEVFIAMISCGMAPDEFKVALSCRNPIDNYITIK